jgi:hypothetical protein
MGDITRMPIPRLTVPAVRRAIAEYDRLGEGAFLKLYGYGRAEEYFLIDRGRRYDSKAIAGVAHGFATASSVPLRHDQFSGGERVVVRKLKALGFNIVQQPTTLSPPSEDDSKKLQLPLHGQTSRKDAYALFGIKFDQRQRQLIKGLSPKLPDGGYFIWITLDKTELEENYDYEDRLEASSFTWVTQRGVTDALPNYRALEHPNTRVSLFVRGQPGNAFTYLGEMRHHSHESLQASGRRPQVRYLFELEHQVSVAARLARLRPESRGSAQSGGAGQAPAVQNGSSPGLTLTPYPAAVRRSYGCSAGRLPD